MFSKASKSLNVKTSSKKLTSSAPSCCTVDLLQIGVKSKFVLWEPRYNNLLTKKKGKKIYFSEPLIFWNILLPSVSIFFFSNNIFKLYSQWKFCMLKFNYFSRRSNKANEQLWNIFDRSLCEVILETKILLLRTRKFYITHPICIISWFI